MNSWLRTGRGEAPCGYVDDVVDLPRGTMVFGDVLVPKRCHEIETGGRRDRPDERLFLRGRPYPAFGWMREHSPVFYDEGNDLWHWHCMKT